jgi:hypothetical protein
MACGQWSHVALARDFLRWRCRPSRVGMTSSATMAATDRPGGHRMLPTLRRVLAASLGTAAAALTTVGLVSASAKADPVSPPTYSNCNVAFNLVANCSFEIGNLTDWTPIAATGSSLAATTPGHSGTASADFAGLDSDDQLSQTIEGTTPGHTYVLGYWLQIGENGTNHFAVTVSNVQGGTQTFDERTNLDTGSATWVYYQDTFVAGDGAPTITFAAYNTLAFTFVDDVVVIDQAHALVRPSLTCFPDTGSQQRTINCTVTAPDGNLHFVRVNNVTLGNTFVVSSKLPCSSGGLGGAANLNFRAPAGNKYKITVADCAGNKYVFKVDKNGNVI